MIAHISDSHKDSLASCVHGHSSRLLTSDQLVNKTGLPWKPVSLWLVGRKP